MKAMITILLAALASCGSVMGEILEVKLAPIDYIEKAKAFKDNFIPL